MSTDVIVGCGIIGAVVAVSIRAGRPDVDLVVVDIGSRIGAWSACISTTSRTRPSGGGITRSPVSAVRRCTLGLSSSRNSAAHCSRHVPACTTWRCFAEQVSGLPGASIASNAGGVGVRWTAATPHDREVPEQVFADEFRRDLERAQRPLGVDADPYAPRRQGVRCSTTCSAPPRLGVVRSRCRWRYGTTATAAWSEPDRAQIFRPWQPAATSAPGCSPRRPACGSSALTATRRGRPARAPRRRRVHDHGRCRGGHRRRPAIRHVIWVSGIRPAAQGTHLNKHALLTGRALLDHERFNLSLRPSRRSATASGAADRRGCR